MRLNISTKTVILILIIISVLLIVFLRYNFQPSYKIEICDKMSSNELKLMCYSMFLKQYKYCSLLGTSSSFCIDFVSSTLDLNESLCKSLEGYNKLSCIISLAIKNKDPNVCKLQENSTLASSCFNSLTSHLDDININEDFCNKISEESLRFTCLAKVKKDIKLCDNIKQEPFEKGNCLAIASKNITYCQNTTSYDYCLFLVAMEAKDSDLCNKITLELTKGECLLRLKKDISYCDSFVADWKDYCILNFFKLKNLKII